MKLKIRDKQNGEDEIELWLEYTKNGFIGVKSSKNNGIPYWETVFEGDGTQHYIIGGNFKVKESP